MKSVNEEPKPVAVFEDLRNIPGGAMPDKKADLFTEKAELLSELDQDSKELYDRYQLALVALSKFQQSTVTEQTLTSEQNKKFRLLFSAAKELREQVEANEKIRKIVKLDIELAKIELAQ